MNKYQRLIVVVAAIDLLILVLVPPFQDIPLARGALPSLAGFFPLVVAYPTRPIFAELLALELIFVAANALTAWLKVRSQGSHDLPPIRIGRGIAAFVAVNLGIVLLFPPYQQYNMLARDIGASFDSFYFVFGGRSARPLFGPLLYLEIIFIVINALAIYLLFNTVRRAADQREEALLTLADHLDPDALAHLTAEMRAEAAAREVDRQLAHFGRREGERRQTTTPPSGAAERRDGNDRRHESKH